MASAIMRRTGVTGMSSSSGPGATSVAGAGAATGAAAGCGAGAAWVRGCGLKVAQDVVSGDASAEAGALNPVQVDGVLAGEAANGGGEALPAVGGACRRGGDSGGRRRGWNSRRGNGRRRWSGGGLGHRLDADHGFHGFDGGAASGSDGGDALHQVAGGRCGWGRRRSFGLGRGHGRS